MSDRAERRGADSQGGGRNRHVEGHGDQTGIGRQDRVAGRNVRGKERFLKFLLFGYDGDQVTATSVGFGHIFGLLLWSRFRSFGCLLFKLN